MTPARPEPAGPRQAGVVALRVTTIELFFDLVFAFTLTQLTTLLSDDASPASAVQVLLIFSLIWWMYAGYAWLTNTRPPSGAAERLPLLIGMGGLLIAGLAIPEGFGRNGAVLGLGYLVVVLVHAWLYQRANRNFIRVAPFNIAAALLVTAAGLISRHPGGSRPAVYALWVAAVVVQVGSPLVLKPGGLFHLQPAHIVERHTALVIVALGESVAAVGIGAARLAGPEGGMTPSLVGAALLGLALCAALWWALFGSSEDDRSQESLAGTDAARRTGVILNAYFYAYTALLLGIVAISAGIEQAIARAHTPVAAEPAAAAVLLAAGAAAVLAGDIAFRRLMGMGRARLRLAAAALSAATVVAGLTAGLPAQLGLLTAILAAMIAAERRLEPARNPARNRRPRPPGPSRDLREDRAVIERYTLPAMGRIWGEEHKYELWCRVETLVLEAHARAGTVPEDSVAPVRAAPPPTPQAVAELEAVTGHDVIAFLSAWADNTQPRQAAAYVHYGMTSSDLLDTALALQLTESTDLLAGRCAELTAVLREHALAHRATLRVGRTHGIHAEPDVWGHRVADFAFAMHRCGERLARARAAVAVGKLSGPVGTYSNIDPAIEAEVMAALVLRPADVATQVVLRDGISEWVSVLALIATVCEAIALEVRHGQRTEVAELAEAFGRGQKGSSAMPHKRNPVRSERISGLARIVRAQIVPVMEGIPLWHERDISHSSTERVALPDAAAATDYLLEQTTGLMRGLVVDADRMRANLDSTHGLIYTSAVLLELVSNGMSREDAYALVQAAAMDTWANGTPLRDTLRRHAATGGQRLDEARLDEACRPERYTEHLTGVFDRLEAL